jgi:hypothetical protein
MKPATRMLWGGGGVCVYSGIPLDWINRETDPPLYTIWILPGIGPVTFEESVSPTAHINHAFDPPESVKVLVLSTPSSRITVSLWSIESPPSCWSRIVLPTVEMSAVSSGIFWGIGWDSRETPKTATARATTDIIRIAPTESDKPVSPDRLLTARSRRFHVSWL